MSTATKPVVLLMVGPVGALSGGDIHALQLALGLAESGFRSVEVVGPSSLRSMFAGASVLDVHEVSTPLDRFMGRSPLALVAGLAVRGLRAVPRCRGASVVVASSHLIFDVVPAVLSHVLWRTPVVSFVYHVIETTGRPMRGRARLAVQMERLSLRLLRMSNAHIFVDLDEARAELLARGFSAKRLIETANAYDPVGEIPPPKPATPLRAAFVGRLVERKGLADVVAIARRLAASGSAVQIDVVGDGPDRSAMMAMISDAGLSNVTMHGFVSETTKWKLLSEASLFLAPSVEEGWGIAVGEALLAGVPVLAKDLPAYRHFGTRIDRTPNIDGGAFVERAIALLDDPNELAIRIEQTQARRSTLPSWSSVIERDIREIEAIVE